MDGNELIRMQKRELFQRQRDREKEASRRFAEHMDRTLNSDPRDK